MTGFRGGAVPPGPHPADAMRSAALRRRDWVWRLPERFGMTDHDEMTGASAWDDWQAAHDNREQLAAIGRAVIDAVQSGQVVGTIRWPPGGPPSAGLSALIRTERRELAQIRDFTGQSVRFRRLS